MGQKPYFSWLSELIETVCSLSTIVQDVEDEPQTKYGGNEIIGESQHADEEEVLSVALIIDASKESFYRRAAKMAPNEAIAALFGYIADAVKDK
jgi:rubrerythrin